jgi:LPXTG-motif cell wall-anchored protein
MDINTQRGVCEVTTQCPSQPAPPQPTCPKRFDGGSFVGGIFLMIGVGILGAAGFVFYRKKQGLGYAAL